MTFVELEKQYGNFYAPTYTIEVDGTNVQSKLYLEITSVEVDLSLKEMSRFSFTVNSPFQITGSPTSSRAYKSYPLETDKMKDLFAFGKSVKISMGYADKQNVLHQGVITALQFNFPASGLPQINVSGYDLSYCMSKGRRSDPGKNKKDSEIVAQIARKYGLTPIVEDSRVEHPQIEQSQESDLNFVRRLAERNGYEFYVFNKNFYFRPPSDKKDDLLTLTWGESLISFNPEINLAEQVSSVEVRGWNVATKQAIVGTAKAGDEERRGQDNSRRSGAEDIKKVCKDQDNPLRLRLPVYSQQEADRRARSILKRRSEMYVQGSGNSIGLPDILPDTNIKLSGMGTIFDKRYYVEQSTHTINSSGYMTTFKVKEPII